MRLNLPITGVDVLVPSGETLVSSTDLKGRITRANPAFVRISGYTEQEMLGEPHNLVRHPDMPAEAFQDLWETLRAGRPWTGYLKNRCKNGNGYWVLANVTLLREDGRVSGYLSVRTPPDMAKVREIARHYRRFRDGHSKGLAIREGQVVETRFLARAEVPRAADESQGI